MHSLVVLLALGAPVGGFVPWAPAACRLAPPLSADAAPASATPEDSGEAQQGGGNLVRKLFRAAKRRITPPRETPPAAPTPVDPDDAMPLPQDENSALYAELAKRRAAVEEEASLVKDAEIYDALAAKTDFPRVAKKLQEALQNRSLVDEAAAPRQVGDFEPSSGQTPGEVISGVLRALRDDGVKDDGTLEYGGVETLLKFTSSASSLGATEAHNPVAIAQFFSRSEYSILLTWDNIVFPSPLRLSLDGTKAYQTTKLRDAKTSAWHKVKWCLSLRDEDENKDGKWLIDTIIVTQR